MNWVLEKRKVDIVILCLGANDMLRGIKPSLIKKNLNKILEILQEKKINILLAGMLAQETLGKRIQKQI